MQIKDLYKQYHKVLYFAIFMFPLWGQWAMWSNPSLPVGSSDQGVGLGAGEIMLGIDFNYQLNAFFGDWVNSFWNKVLDSALCTIAIELSDWKFIDINCENDGSQLIHLKHNLSVLKGEYDAFSKSKNEKNLSFIRLLQFINCFAYFPFIA